MIPQLAVSADRASGSRTNLVIVNPAKGPVPDGSAKVTVRIRRGDGSLLSSASIGPLPVNGFEQIALDAASFAELAGVTDSNLWAEYASDHPVLAYASVIDNASGDSFAIVATPEVLQ